MEEFQRWPRFPRKIVLCSSTNSRILKPWAITSNLIRFDLGFWQPWKSFYMKLKYRENVLEEFQRLPCFTRKMILYSSTNFRSLKPGAIISNFIRFDLVFWKTSKPFYRKLKYRQKVLEEFRRLPRFPRKMVLYSSTNFCSFKPWALISNLIRFDLGFWQASIPFYWKLIYREKVLEEFQRFRHFPRKMVFLLVNQFTHFKALCHYFQPYKIPFRLLAALKTIL